MIRQVHDDLYQIGEYVRGAQGVEAVRVYVLLNEGRPVLIDCGSHLHRRQIMAEMEEVLAGATPEYIFLTHSELPHAGNIQAVSEKWPGIKVIVSNVMLPYIEVLPVLPLEQMRAVVPGHKIEFPTRTLEFVDALLKDQPGSQWIYDSRTQTLFTGDGFGYYQEPERVDHFSDEVPGGISVEQFRQYHYNAFRFLRWIRPERMGADLDKMFARRPIRHIAPIHGSAIRGDTATHLARLKEALALACGEMRRQAVHW